MSGGERLAAALDSVAGRVGEPVELALILGTGLGGLAAEVEALVPRIAASVA